jgi:hypothetical protein
VHVLPLHTSVPPLHVSPWKTQVLVVVSQQPSSHVVPLQQLSPVAPQAVPPLLEVKPPLLDVTPPLLLVAVPLQDDTGDPPIDSVAPLTVHEIVQPPPLVSEVQTTPEVPSVPQRQRDCPCSSTLQHALLFEPEQPTASATATGIPKRKMERRIRRS